jgi:lipoprotein-releasing system permease protein
MLVKDKSSDIAILRTMGATSGSILRVFLITGASIGIVGTLAGFALGLLICLNIQGIQDFVARVSGTQLWDPTVRFLTQIPAEINAAEVATVVLTAFGLSLVATIYPSWRAARLDPVQALRYG